MKTDAQLKKDIQEELGWDPAVNATNIGVIVKDGIVTLTGHLDSFAEKYAAERRFAKLPVVPNCTYVQPSETIPVSLWDYTNETAIQSAYELGRRDGEKFCLNTTSHLKETHEHA